MNLPMHTILIDEFATSAEIIHSFSNLSNADLSRLKSIAQLRARGLVTFDWEDLIQEAVSRALEGFRKWPKNIPFIAFLAQTIRSIANEEWRRLINQNTTNASDLDSIDGEDPLIDQLAITLINPEREIIAKNILVTIESLFINDKDATAILLGSAHGDSPDVIQGKSNLTLTQYASAQKRIRRKISQTFLNGDKR